MTTKTTKTIRTTTATTPTPERINRLSFRTAVLLRVAGWEPRELSINQATGTLRLVLYRDDGRIAILHRDSSGRSSLTIEKQYVELVRGQEVIHQQLVRRRRYDTLKYGFEDTAQYVIDNPCHVARYERLSDDSRKGLTSMLFSEFQKLSP